jgi:hypothetical protein
MKLDPPKEDNYKYKKRGKRGTRYERGVRAVE